MARVYVGLSGYSYKAWQGSGRFYPEDLKPVEFLHYYASRYHTVELDGVWYRLPTDKTVRSWLDQTPAEFLFAPKAHRQITHLHRLKPEGVGFVRLLLDRLAPLIADGRLGPILLQLPPNLPCDLDRLKTFLAQLPRTARWAMEFRHASWHVTEVETLLRDSAVGWVAAETDETPAEHRDTAAFWYIRLRRRDYDEPALAEWARRFNAMVQRGKDCFVYCKHDDEGSPWIWADRILALTATPEPS